MKPRLRTGRPGPEQEKRNYFSIPKKIDGHLVYAIGDIHGCYAILKMLLEAIYADANEHARGREVILIFCGDYVDRGPDSSLVLDTLCWLQRYRPFEMYFLKGNHEDVLNNYIRDPSKAVDWMRFGGRETLLSYGVVPPDADAPPTDHYRARDDLLEVMPVSHMRFLESLDLMVTIGDYAFVHAGVNPANALGDQGERDLLWIRDEFLASAKPFEKMIVHGHTWTGTDVEILPNRIGIDTGTYETGILSAIRIEDGGVMILQSGRLTSVTEPRVGSSDLRKRA